MSFDPRDPELFLPCLALLGAGVALAYGLIRARNWRDEFGLVDAAILLLSLATGTAAAVPLVNAVQQRASSAVLMTDLSILRTQINLYKAQHNGSVPLLYHGTFPQLTQATNLDGVPGTGGAKFPYGPYLREGIPPNALTGVATVTAVDEFPPKAATGVGGWAYHQESGRIAPDVEGYLDR